MATDERPHWDDLPPGRRQNYTALAAAGGILSVAGGVTAALVARRRRSASAATPAPDELWARLILRPRPEDLDALRRRARELLASARAGAHPE